MASDKDGGDSGAGIEYALLAAAGLLVVVFVAPALLLSAGVWFLIKDRFGRKEYVILLLCGVLAWILAARYAVMSYGPWMWNTLLGHPVWSTFPWFTLLSTICVLTGAFGLLAGTRLTKRLPARFLTRSARAPADRATILPTADELAHVSSVVTAPGASTAPLVEDGKVGSRKFQLAVGASAEPVMLSEAELRTHMMLLGATGSGKTETIKVLAGSLLGLGWSGMVLDLKEDAGSGGLREWCEQWAAMHSAPYQELCSSVRESDTWFNPLDGLGPDEIRDTILALQEFDDAHWANVNKEMLGQLVNLMVWAHQADPVRFKAPTMYEMGKILAQDNLPAATKQRRAVVTALPGVDAESFSVLTSPADATKKSAPGYGAKLTQIFETQAGRTVLRPGPENTRRVIDVTAGGLTYIGLDSLGKADLTQMVSAAVLQRMSAYAAARTTGLSDEGPKRHPRFLIVDEAGWINRHIVTNLLARARSAGIAVILCTQGPLDWIDKQGDDWGMMTNNVNVALIMKQGSPESATLCADYIGQALKEVTSETVRTSKGLLWDKPMRNASGEVMESHSIREDMAYLIEPEDLRKMQVGDVVVRTGTPTTEVKWGKVRMRTPGEGEGRWHPAEID